MKKNEENKLEGGAGQGQNGSKRGNHQGGNDNSPSQDSQRESAYSSNIIMDHNLSISASGNLNTESESNYFSLGITNAYEIAAKAQSLDAEGLTELPISRRVRKGKAESIKVPHPRNLLMDNDIVQTTKAATIWRAMKYPEIVARFFTLNIGGFINYADEEYFIANKSVKKDLVWDNSSKSKIKIGNILITPYFSQMMNIVKTNSGISTYDFPNESGEVKSYTHPILYNQYSDSVLHTAAGDKGTLLYKRSLNKVRKSLAESSSLNVFNGLTTLVVKPALFRTFFEHPVMLSTLLHLTFKSINLALKNQGIIIDKNGLPDPIINHLITASRADKIRLLHNLTVLQNFTKTVPYNKAVLQRVSKDLGGYTLTGEDSNILSNSVVFPVYQLALPKTELLCNKDEWADGYSDGVYADVESGVSSKLTLNLNSILVDFLKMITSKVPTVGNAAFSLSGVSFTPYMSSFISTMMKTRPSVISQYINDTVVIWANLLQNNAYSDTIFEVSPVELPDVFLKQELNSSLPKLNSDNEILSFLPIGLKSINSMDEVFVFPIVTDGFIRNINLDNTINFTLFSKIIRKSTDSIGGKPVVYLKDGILSNFVTFDKDSDKAIPHFSCHDESKGNYTGIVLTEGNNEFLAYNVIKTLSINPFIPLISKYDTTVDKGGIVVTLNNDKEIFSSKGFGAPVSKIQNGSFSDALSSVTYPGFSVIASRLDGHTVFGIGYSDSVYGAGADRLTFTINLRDKIESIEEFTDVEYQNIL